MASYNTVITNEGAALLASVIANQGTLTFSEMRFSTTDYDGVEATLTVGTFAGVFITAAASASVVDSTTIKVGAQFDNSGIVGDHPLYSIGIVGTDGNTTALIAVCTTTNPDIIRAALTGVSTYAFNVNLAVSSTSDITVTGTTAAVLYNTDIIDTLNSTDATKPLSANMGHTLGEEINAIVNAYGAKNLLPKATKGDSYYGGTFTPNTDGSVIVSGTTATADIYFPIMGSATDKLYPEAGDYIVSGGNSTAKVRLDAYSGNTYVRTLGTSPSSESVTVDYVGYDHIRPFVFVANGTDLTTPVTVYPMVRDARIVDPTYEPYAETNQQLTVNKANRSDLASLDLTGTKNTTGVTITAGTYFYLNGQYCRATQDILNNVDFTENTNYVGATVGEAIKQSTAACSLPTGMYGAVNEITKVGNVVTLNLDLINNDAQYSFNENDTIAMIPTGYRPRTVLYVPMFNKSNTPITVYITASGNIKVYTATGLPAADFFFNCITYVSI